ncbi:MAG: DNA topoisomerase I [Nanoarchaeota archaeon]|nr:DNA topoisomerase I [Nanoarchaeota archaeon]
MMPRKQKKSKEERLAEGFFPVDSGDLKNAIEKSHKTIDPRFLDDVVEDKPKKTRKKVIVRKTRKRAVSKSKTKRGSKAGVEFEAPKVKLKDGGYELIITEKPQAALKISSALGKSVKRAVSNVPYYEVDRKGNKIIVACAVGHLFTLAQKTPNPGKYKPSFELAWVPNYFVRNNDFSKKYYDVLTKLVEGAGTITVATDYDNEGEVIGWNIVRFVAGQNDASRMRFSTLTDKELNESYDSKSDNINWGQAFAGETRHYLDWIYGINLSRALMEAIKSTGKFRIMSIGRVQGPALNLVVERERKIQSFKPEPYWQVFINVESEEGESVPPTQPKAPRQPDKKGQQVELVHPKNIFDKKELEKFEGIFGKTGIAKTEKKEQSLPPNVPFNLTTLQMEAYRLFGITPVRTLAAAQSLYLAGLISYPRTSSQKLPLSINYGEILSTLSKNYNVGNLITKKKPIEGKKSDPAHPSIYPTGEHGADTMNDNERKIYDLIVKRFLCLFMDDAIVENKKITVDVDSLIFNKKGSSIKKASWLSVYPGRVKEESIPDLEGEVSVIDSRTESKMTQPPKRYSPASIISELEKRNLGTKATRSNIVETLYDRGYIQDQSIKATALGMSLIETLDKHSPIIIDEGLTRDFETEMERMQELDKGYLEKEGEVLKKAEGTITSILSQFGKGEKEIGNELLKANVEMREQQKEANRLNICPLCKKGSLGITYSKKTRRYFVACDAYPNCKNTFSLPPNGMIKKSEKVCDDCGFPKLMRLSKGKRPWEFCFNPECPENKKRIEEYRKRKAEGEEKS